MMAMINLNAFSTLPGRIRSFLTVSQSEYQTLTLCPSCSAWLPRYRPVCSPADISMTSSRIELELGIQLTHFSVALGLF